jgi:ribosomal protein S16
VLYWLSVGAQPSDRFARVALKNGISECEKFIKERVMKPSRAEREAAEQAKKEAEEAQKAAKEQKANEEKQTEKNRNEGRKGGGKRQIR